MVMASSLYGHLHERAAPLRIQVATRLSPIQLRQCTFQPLLQKRVVVLRSRLGAGSAMELVPGSLFVSRQRRGVALDETPARQVANNAVQVYLIAFSNCGSTIPSTSATAAR